MVIPLILPGLISFLLALLITPAVRSLMIRWGVIDAPDGFRKLHTRSVPLAGGLAIMLACALTLGIGAIVGLAWVGNIALYPQISLGIAAGALLIGVVGLLDDRYRLRGRQKLLGQVAASLLAVAGGLVINKVAFFGWQIELGLLAVPVTLLWLLGAINALNLIDGVDGLATSVGIVMCLTLSILSCHMDHLGDAAATATLAGALLGFLPYNWRPARMFLGDTGSMFIGFMLGVLAIRGNLKGPATVALIAPAAIWAIPLFDVAMAILRRKLTGQSIYATDRGHLHHSLQGLGLGHVGTVLVTSGLCLICGLGALISLYLKNEFAAVVATGSVLLMLVSTRMFGHVECQLLARKASNFLQSLCCVSRSTHPHDRFSSRLRGSREFDQAWESLVGFAERFDLSSLNFNVNAPMLGEVFHAHWENGRQNAAQNRWTSDVPLIWNAHEIGRVSIHGEVPTGQSPFSWSSELMEALCPFERIVLDLLGNEQFACNGLRTTSRKSQDDSALIAGGDASRGPRVGHDTSDKGSDAHEQAVPERVRSDGVGLFAVVNAGTQD